MDMIQDILVGPFYALGRYFWNSIMQWVEQLLTMTPMAFAPDAWSFVTGVLYPWMLGIGVTLLNLFFFVGVFRQASNLKQNFTLEIFVETGIKWVVANGLMLSGLTLMQSVLTIASAMITELNSFGSYDFRVTEQEIDVGMVLFLWVFGLVYLIVSVVCGLMILMTVYGRYLQLYVLVAVAPLAMGTCVGGPGIAHTASSWGKTFLAKVFEIVVIAIILILASKISMNIAFYDSTDGFGDWFDGMVLAFQNIVQMVILTTSVKGIDNFMRRTFGL